MRPAQGKAAPPLPFSFDRTIFGIRIDTWGRGGRKYIVLVWLDLCDWIVAL